jgi:putative transposase
VNEYRVLPAGELPFILPAILLGKVNMNDDGTLLEIHDCLRRAVRAQQGREPDLTAIVMDSQSVKTAEAGGERGFDGGKQVNGRKRQLVVDTACNLLTVAVHAANIQDQDGVQPVLNETHDVCPTVATAI